MATYPPRRALPWWLTEIPLAHRGLHGPGVPENSVAAFVAAREAGCGVELDVHVTADGVPIVVHDHDLVRVAGVALDVRTAPFAAVREHLLEDGSVIPTLDEVLAELGDSPVMIEIKNLGRGPTGREAAIAEAIDRFDTGRQYVASFHPASLRWFRQHRPRVIRAQTAQAATDPRVPVAVGRAAANLSFNGRSLPHLLSYEVTGLAHPAVRRWRQRGGVVVAWTVRTAEHLAMARAAADNVVFEDIAPPV